MFGIDIIDAGLLPAITVALMAGIISFLSPCVLPIVPPYLAYMSGVSVTDLSSGQAARNKAVLPALFFVLGLSTVFLFLGFTASAIGAVFLQYQSVFNTVAGILVMVFGAHFVGVYRIRFLDREARIDVGDRGGSALGAYVLGLAFAFGWTPCVGPVLASILFMAAGADGASLGVLLLFAYGIGMTLPFVVAAMFIGPFMRWMAGFRKHLGLVEKLMGGLLILFGVLIATNSINLIAQWMIETFPVFSAIG